MEVEKNATRTVASRVVSTLDRLTVPDPQASRWSQDEQLRIQDGTSKNFSIMSVGLNTSSCFRPLVVKIWYPRTGRQDGSS
jgi:hypothetical protein